MNQFQMTESDKEKFLSGDEGRGEIRREASNSNPAAESIHIVDSEGNLFDNVSGASFSSDDDTDPGLAIVLTDEQLDARRTESALQAADLARVEEDLKPQVYAKLKDEARGEIREEYREIIQGLRSDKAELANQVGRLTEGVTTLSSKNQSLIEELALLKARSQ